MIVKIVTTKTCKTLKVFVLISKNIKISRKIMLNNIIYDELLLKLFYYLININ